jgi:hypothetical protein
MIEELTYIEIEEVLQDQVIGRIGCCSSGSAYIVPVSYAYSDPYVYIYSLEGKKVDIMRENPAVCFEVDEIQDILNWKSVVAYGTFEELKGTLERQKAWKILADRSLPLIGQHTSDISPQGRTANDDVNEIEGIFYRIELKEKNGRFKSDLWPR